MKHLVLVMLIRMTAASLFLLLQLQYEYQKYSNTYSHTDDRQLLCELSKWMILPSNGRIT